MTSVQFGSISMVAGPARDGDFIVESGFFSDWYTVSATKMETRERPSADGAFGVDHEWRSELLLTMEGRFRGDSWPAMLDALTRVAVLGTTVTTTVTDVMGTSSRELRVRSFKPKLIPGAKICYFAMDLAAPDPRRYGPMQQATTALPTAGTGQPWPQTWPADWGTGGSPGRLTVSNPGSAVTSPLLKVSGGLSDGVELVEVTTGSYLRLERQIPLGSAAFFDTRTSRVYLDTPANDISGFTTRRDWAGFRVPAGSTRVLQFNGLGAPSGSPLLTAQFSPAY